METADMYLREPEAATLLSTSAPIQICLEKSKIVLKWRDPSTETRVVNERAAEALLGMDYDVWCFATRTGDWFIHVDESAFSAFLTWEGCRDQQLISDSERVYIGHTSEEVAWMLGINIAELGGQLRVGRLPTGASRVIICT